MVDRFDRIDTINIFFDMLDKIHLRNMQHVNPTKECIGKKNTNTS